MRKSLLTTIAGAALIAGGGLAAAQQRMESSPGGANGAQGSPHRQPGGAAQPGAMQGPAEGRSQATGEEGQRSGHFGTMQGPAQGRSSAVEENEHRSRYSGAMEGQAPRRHPRAMQSQAQGRSGTEQSRGGVTEQRSVASPTLSPGQKTRLHEVIAGGNVQRVHHADFALSVGTRVPNTVRLYDVPNTIVDVLPQYRGFEYIVVRHDLVIIDPATLEIVAVLPV